MASVLFFTMGKAVCAPIAKDFAVFFVGRAIQGIGGGGIIAMGQVIFADIVPLRQRPKYFSIVLAAWALGSVLGPLIGGLFVEHVIWAWCFYINVRRLPCLPLLPYAAESLLTRPGGETVPVLRTRPCPCSDLCQAQDQEDVSHVQARAGGLGLFRRSGADASAVPVLLNLGDRHLCLRYISGPYCMSFRLDAPLELKLSC